MKRIRFPELTERIAPASTLNRWQAEDTFPPPEYLPSSMRAYRVEIIEEWERQNILLDPGGGCFAKRAPVWDPSKLPEDLQYIGGHRPGDGQPVEGENENAATG